MTKEQFLSIFKAYATRTLNIAQSSADDYCSYLRGLSTGNAGIDYLQRIAECNHPYRQLYYADMMERNIPANYTQKKVTNCYSVIAALKKYIDRNSAVVHDWPKFGPDMNTFKDIVEYDKGIAPCEQVTDLCAELKSEYIQIIRLAKSIFSDLLTDDDYKYIPVYLKTGLPEIIEYPISEEYLNKLRELAERDDATEEELIQLRTRKISFVPLAKFCFSKTSDKCFIEIYYANFSAQGKEGYLARISNLLAHEYMHYLHYRYCKRIGNFSTYDDAEIRESMADFFAMIYSVYRGGNADLNYTLERYAHWARMYNSGWPYAHAILYFTVNGREKYYSERLWDFERNKLINKLLIILNYSDNETNAKDMLLSRIPLGKKKKPNSARNP